MNPAIYQPMIGADPEIFIKDRKTDQFVSAHTFIQGTKYEPKKTHFGAIQLDGVAAEFNIHPAKDVISFLKGCKHGLTYIAREAAKYNVDYEPAIVPVATFKDDYFLTIPEQQRELGCNPDFNSYTADMNQLPYTDLPFRTASGHVHLGWNPPDKYIPPFDEAHFMDCCAMVKQLDSVLYILSHLWDSDTTRRTLYGAKGAFRPKPYGVEYRVLSNAWLNDPLLQAWVFNATMHAMVLHDEHDIILYHDKYILNALEKDSYSKEYLVMMMNYLVDVYSFPALPVKYTLGNINDSSKS